MNLGWLEFQLLIQIYQRDSYGYEILNELKNSGKVNISTGLLYPTLKRLEKKGFVNKRRYEKNNTPDRLYYSITKEGQLVLENMMKYILTIIDRNMWDQLKELREIILQKADIREGDIVIDFSDVIGELFTIDLAKKVGPLGKVYLIVNNIDQKKVFEEYFLINGMLNIKPIVGEIPYDNIATSSLDSAVQVIGLHHSKEPREIIIEMIRIIRPGRKIIISDMQKIDHIIFNNICRIFLPQHYRAGTSEHELSELLSKSKLKNIKISNWHGMVIGEGTK